MSCFEKNSLQSTFYFIIYTTKKLIETRLLITPGSNRYAQFII